MRNSGHDDSGADRTSGVAAVLRQQLHERCRHRDRRLEGDTFSPKQIVEATGLLGSIVHPLIHKLRDAHFLEFVGRVPGERTLLYRIRDNYWWKPRDATPPTEAASAERTAS